VIGGVSFAGQSPFHIPAEVVDVTVDATTTIATGGTNDWHGRAYVVRRSDGVLVMVNRPGTSHLSAVSELAIRFSDDNGATWTAANTKLTGGAVSGFPMTPSTGEINAGEGMPILTATGRIVLFMWRIDGGDWPGDSLEGTQVSYSEDGGESWTAPVGVTFSGVSDQGLAFATDDWFVHPDTDAIYTCLRIYNADIVTDSYCALIVSEDDGDTWTKVSNITAPGSDTQETGIEYVGNSCIVALVGSLNNDETIQAISTNMGTSWTTSDVTATAASITRRHKIYTRAHLKGQANWWKDPVLVVSCFENQTPGSSQDRINATLIGFWNAGTQTVAWDSLHYLDVEASDGGYGDIFYDADNDQWVQLGGQGTLTALSLKQYRSSIAGI
jgi:hypothetical protein